MTTRARAIYLLKIDLKRLGYPTFIRLFKIRLNNPTIDGVVTLWSKMEPMEPTHKASSMITSSPTKSYFSLSGACVLRVPRLSDRQGLTERCQWVHFFYTFFGTLFGQLLLSMRNFFLERECHQKICPKKESLFPPF